MACPVLYPGLPCHLSGVGYTAQSAPLGAASLTLMTGHGAQFPELSPGQWFYAEVTDACGDCCETVRVTARDSDVLTILRDAPVCDCFASASRVRYLSTTRDAILAIAAEVELNVLEPLMFDCESRTLSIDCEKLREMVRECEPEEPESPPED